MAKKVVDSWKSKSWYALVAPKIFNEAKVTEVPSLDEEHLLNRVINIPLKEITRDLAHMYSSVRLRVTEIKGKTAFTKFIGHSVAREYLHTLIRCRRDALYVVFDAVSKDEVEFRVKALVVTAHNCSAAQKTTLRNRAAEFLKKKIAREPFGQFIQEVLYGKASTETYGTLKRLVPLRRVEIYKTELKEVFDVAENQAVPGSEAAKEKPKEQPTEEESE
ncbi:TPA: hypothetical protein HA318_00770 [Candidatus Micrarchaeota archaeon]|nr:MAG: hypothetical protein AUJ65_00610 [Candidatus Micrarchaeota archaeon CG1_02_51_15]HII38521.1 hypothetical protein [Candidatus Micrarchaeota archaeon]